MQCPVDFIPINENKVRLTALFIFILTIVYLLNGFWLIMAFLLVDFSLRAFNFGKYSLLGFISDAIIKQFKIKNKPVDRAPKRFAAGVGLFFSLAILIAAYFNQPLMVYSLSGVIVLFAFLESFLGFCAGCYVYAAVKILFK